MSRFSNTGFKKTKRHKYKKQKRRRTRRHYLRGGWGEPFVLGGYDKKFKHINRKNFINTQYVLYNCLCRHKHQCKKEEFIILKTIDRKFFHDEICKVLFEELGWNHTPYF